MIPRGKPSVGAMPMPGVSVGVSKCPVEVGVLLPEGRVGVEVTNEGRVGVLVGFEGLVGVEEGSAFLVGVGVKVSLGSCCAYTLVPDDGVQSNSKPTTILRTSTTFFFVMPVPLYKFSWIRKILLEPVVSVEKL